jgi:hypothetical protein
MSKILLVVETSTKTKNNNYMTKLVGKTEGVKTAFGEVEGGNRTFYMFTDQENPKGLSAEIELDDFDVVKNDYPFTDDKGEEQTAVLSYLYPKRTV